MKRKESKKQRNKRIFRGKLKYHALRKFSLLSPKEQQEKNPKLAELLAKRSWLGVSIIQFGNARMNITMGAFGKVKIPKLSVKEL